MDRPQVESIARAWVAMHHAPPDSEQYRDNFWAYEQIDELREEDPEACWRIIQVILHLDSSDEILSNLAAGPVEDLLGSHGEKFIERIETAASEDASFRKLLAAVWENNIPQEIWTRVKKVAGAPW